MINASLYALDTPRLNVVVENVQPHELQRANFYRLRIGKYPSELTAFLTPAQLVSIQDAIRAAYVPAESDESYEASEALQRFRIPVMQPVTARVTMPAELVLATEDEIERLRR